MRIPLVLLFVVSSGAFKMDIFQHARSDVEKTLVDRILDILGFKRNVCPFNGLPLIRDIRSDTMETKYQTCTKQGPERCPHGYVCERSRHPEHYICCSAGMIRGVTPPHHPSVPGSSAVPLVTATPSAIQITRVTEPSTEKQSPPSTQHRPTNSLTWSPWGPAPVLPTTEDIKRMVDEKRMPPNRNLNTIRPFITKTTRVPSTTTASSTTVFRPPQTTTTAPSTPKPRKAPRVELLQQGRMVRLGRHEFMITTTVAYIEDDNTRVLVDTSSAVDAEKLSDELRRIDVVPEEIDQIIFTHLHPPHFGSVGLFKNAHKVFGDWVFRHDKLTKTDLSNKQVRKITDSVEIWKTPGFGPDDLSVIIRNVPNYGIIAVVGDLILNEHALEKPKAYEEMEPWSAEVRQHNTAAILCMADWIVPAHGNMFPVRPEQKARSNCNV